jgi:hypothetical protein
MFLLIVSVHIKFHIPCSNGPLLKTTKLNATGIVPTATMLLLYVCKKNI